MPENATNVRFSRKELMLNSVSIVAKLAGCLVLAIMVPLLMAACGGPNQLPAATSQTTAVPAGTQVNMGAWQQKWDKTLAAAKQEGTLTLYGDISPRLRDAISSFQNKYGITMDFAIGPGGQIETKWINEKNAGLSQADVFHMASGSAAAMKAAGGFAPVEPYFILPETADPKAWYQGRFPWVDADKTMVMLNYTYTSYVTVNTDIIKEGQLKSYRDLLNPEWKGKIIFFDPTIPSASLGWVNFILQDVYGLDAGKEYLRQFAANAPTLSKDATQQMQGIAQGKYPIGVGISSSNTSDWKSRGAPVSVYRFSEGGSINPGSGLVEVSPKPPHPNAAAIYINWLLSEEGQTAFSQGIAATPVLAGLKAEGVDPAKVPLPGEKTYLYGEAHSKFNPEAIRITREAMGDLLK